MEDNRGFHHLHFVLASNVLSQHMLLDIYCVYIIYLSIFLYVPVHNIVLSLISLDLFIFSEIKYGYKISIAVRFQLSRIYWQYFA